MHIKQPQTKEEADSPEGRTWQVINRNFSKNGFPRELIIDGRSWTRISDNGKRHYTGGHRDGGFSHYGEVSINRQNTEIVEITEADVTSTASDTPEQPKPEKPKAPRKSRAKKSLYIGFIYPTLYEPRNILYEPFYRPKFAKICIGQIEARQ